MQKPTLNVKKIKEENMYENRLNKLTQRSQRSQGRISRASIYGSMPIEKLCDTLIFIDSNQFYGIRYFEISIKPFKYLEHYNKDKAILLLNFAKINYKILTSSLNDIKALSKELDFRTILSSYVDIKERTTIRYNSNNLPEDSEKLKKIILSILINTANSLYDYYKYLPTVTEQREAISLLKNMLSLRNDIVNDKYNLKKFNLNSKTI